MKSSSRRKSGYFSEPLEARLLLSTLYVATNGNDSSATPTNPATPYKTIQKATTVVNPGDTVIVAPGVYYGPITLTRTGTATQPITFKADAVAQNRVVITNANKNIREKTTLWTLVDANLKMYSVPMDHFPARVLYDGVDLLPYQSMAQLQAFKMGVGLDYPGTPSGYWFDSAQQKLFVRLRADLKYGSVDPNQHIMAVAPVYGGGGKGYNIGTSGTLYNFAITPQTAAYVVLDGFSFETPGVAAVYVRGSDVTVRNGWFRGAKTGVAGKRDTPDNDTFSANNIVVEYCDWSQFPAYSDAVEIIHQYADTWYDVPRDGDWKFFWWQRKGQSDDKWLDSNLDYESPGITEFMGTSWTIRYNHIWETFDGIGTYAMEGMNGADIYGNFFEKIPDNGIEFENHGHNIRLFQNEFKDVFMPISWQPLGGTPWPTDIYVFKNLIHQTDGFGAMWKVEGQYRGAWLKIGAAEKQWPWYSWMADVPKSPVNPGGQGVWFYNNTIVAPSMQFLEKINSNSQLMEGVYFQNNIFVCEDWFQNYDISSNYWTMTFSRNVRSSDVVMNPINENHIAGTSGVTLRNPALVGFVNMAGGNYSLTSTSPARNLGTAVPNRPASEWSTDAGAIPFGTTWTMAPLGPQTVGVPSVPVGLNASSSNAQVALTWAVAAGAVSYNVKRSTVNGGSYSTIAPNIRNTSYVDTAVTNGTTYYYVVSAVNPQGESADSIQASATPQVPSAPAAPSNLAATAFSTTQINLTWADNSGTETGFEVDYSTNSTFASGVTTLPLNTPNLTGASVTGLTPATTYYFRVRALNGTGSSSNSNTATTSTQSPSVGGDVNIDFDTSTDYSDNFRELGNYTANIGWDASGVVAMSHMQNWRTGVAIYDTTPTDGQTNTNVFGGTSALEQYSIDFRIGTSGSVKLFARVANPTINGGYYLMADLTGSNALQLRIPTTAVSPDNEVSLAETPYTMTAGTWYTMVFTLQNNAQNTAVTLTGKLFPQGTTSGSPLATVSYTHATSPYLAAGQTGFASASGGTTAPSATTNVDNFVVGVSTPAFAAIDGNGVLRVDGTSAADSFSLSVSGSSLTVMRGTSSLSFATSAFSSVVVDGGTAGDDTLGVMTAIGKPVTFNGNSGNDTLQVNAGTYTFASDANAGNSNLSIIANAGAQVAFNASQHLASLDVRDGGRVVLGAEGSRILRTRGLAIASTGVLDLNDNEMIVDYTNTSPVTTIRNWISAGRSGGTWTGAGGMTSTSAKNNSSHTTTLAPMEASEYASLHGGMFDGETPGATSVLVKYTYYGDANFSGTVNFDDYVRTDVGFNTARSGWSNGDFNGDGTVNFDDYVLLDTAFNTQSSPLGAKTPPPKKNMGTR